ncbi:MAG: ATP-binding protein [Streptomycetales bacterium]
MEGEEEFFSDGTPIPDDSTQGGEGKGGSQAQLLLGLAEETYRLVRSADGRTYAVPKLGPNLALPLGSRTGAGVRAKLADSLWRRTGKVASSSALSDVINVLEGEAAELDPQPVFLRMARHDLDGEDQVVVDMGTETGQAILITPAGWGVEAVSPVIFARSALTHPLVEPVRGGSLDGLRGLLNLSEEDYRLVIGWVVAAYLIDMPHPILLVQGEQGTAKSNLVRALLALIDPQPAVDREAPSDKREWAIFARASWAFSFDNITEIPQWLSNSLCKGVTGDAVLQRVLHSDEDIAVFAFQRVIAATTIGIRHELASDLADRTLLVEPEVLERRLTETEVRAAREAALPQALGAVLDLVAGALRELPAVQVADPPRMADFAHVLAALDKVTGWDTLATYRARIAAMSMALIEHNVLAQALHRLATHPSTGGLEPGPWEGTAAELIAALQRVAKHTGLTAADLPNEPRAIGRLIREIAPNLRKVGVDVRGGPRSGRRRPLRVQRVNNVNNVEADTTG